ncbi:MAG: hypothetical protein FP814_11690 [Desulfobacterium sp.]|nr:hypothetical protein [Desulfobacterium sp.]MBU3947023.1 hypothetical protein [Pseudomonadota bacterium]MBU4009859.1 hypothetical protein [Pseudomonadota bacterium]MBU4035696.1 hypothetical protein [Pseudomonadota bacterium]
MADENSEVKKDPAKTEGDIKGGASGNQQSSSTPPPSGPLAKAQCFLVTGVGVSLLVILAFLYIQLHNNKMIPSYDKDKAKEFFLNLGKAQGVVIRTPLSLQEIADTVNQMPDDGNDVLTAEFKERVSKLKGYTQLIAVTPPTGKVRHGGGPSSTLAKSATDASVIQPTDQRIIKIKDEIDKIEKDALALSKNDGFFWITGPWKWLEIIFWGEFGVIIGILSWVCSKAEKGNYTKEMFEDEIYWYLVEIIMGPIVVIAVFFLLKQFIGALMSGVSEEDVKGSIYMTLGVSFTLGLFIRRTLGIFNYIKDKLPLPNTSENQGAKP